MTISAKILADSLSPLGSRLTTFELTYPRFILAELNTHRVCSRNTASSRAIPVEKILAAVTSAPVMPTFKKNKPGMQGGELLQGQELLDAQTEWLRARDSAVVHARRLMEMGVAKEVTNRLLEPFMWTKSILSTSYLGNFFKLRCHPDAQPEFQVLASEMRKAFEASTPKQLQAGDWHRVYIDEEDKSTAAMAVCNDGSLEDGDALASTYHDWLNKISVVRCARVSYVRQGEKREPAKDFEQHDRMRSLGHWSPFEHVAQALDVADEKACLNFAPGWKQYRYTFLEGTAK